jgi:hypothetical protein
LLPGFLAGLFHVTLPAARLALRFVGSVRHRRVVRACLATPRCLDTLGRFFDEDHDEDHEDYEDDYHTVASLLRVLAWEPRAAAHMVRNKFHDKLYII